MPEANGRVVGDIFGAHHALVDIDQVVHTRATGFEDLDQNPTAESTSSLKDSGRLPSLRKLVVTCRETDIGTFSTIVAGAIALHRASSPVYVCEVRRSNLQYRRDSGMREKGSDHTDPLTCSTNSASASQFVDSP